MNTDFVKEQMSSPELGKLFEALSKAQGSIQDASKDSTNPHFRSAYAGLASVWKACRESLSANGLTVIQTTEYFGDDCILCTTLGHSSGEWMKSKTPLINNKKDMQGLGSAYTYARRYALAAIVGVAPAEDDDGEKACEAPPVLSKHQVQLLKSFIEQDENPEAISDLILKTVPVDSLDKIPAERYDKLVKWIKDRQTKQKNILPTEQN